MSLRPLTDRERVERLVPVLLVLATVEHGVADKTLPEHAQVLAWLDEARDEGLAGLPQEGKRKVLARALRAADHALKPYIAEGTDCGKFGLVLYHLLDLLLARGVPVLVEGSPFDAAMQAIISDEGTVAALAGAPRLDGSAAKQARKLLAQLKTQGLYRQVGALAPAA